MAEKQYDFKYLPLEGKLPGKSFERQTEDAINDLGDRVITVEEEFGDISDLAQLAYDTAVDAQNTADKAQSAADNAQTAADNAQATADSALAQAQGAQETADTKAPVYHASEQTIYGVGDSALYGHVKLSDSAGDLDVDGGTAVTPKALQDAVSTIESEIDGVTTDLEERIAQAQATADDAQAAAEAAQATADTAQSAAEEAAQSAASAQNAADEAKSAADAAQLTADTALSAANNNSTLIANLSQEVSEMRQYEVVGTVDLNDYFEEYKRLYVDADSANAPTDAEKCYVAVDIDSDTGAVRQIATGAESGTVWIRNGVVTEPDDDDEGDREVEWGEWTEIGSGSLSGTVGSDMQPVYLDDGTLKPISATIGFVTQPVYVNEGEITAMTASIGTETHLIYMDKGYISASSATVGSTSTPIYLENGEFKECETSGGEAEEALEIARAAQEMATEAQSIAEAAQSAATEAQNTADAAATTANAAQASAESAQNTADSAATAATEAQTTANEALEALSRYLPLTGGDLSGTLTVGDISITTDGHIILPSGVEIY